MSRQCLATLDVSTRTLSGHCSGSWLRLMYWLNTLSGLINYYFNWVRATELGSNIQLFKGNKKREKEIRACTGETCNTGIYPSPYRYSTTRSRIQPPFLTSLSLVIQPKHPSLFPPFRVAHLYQGERQGGPILSRYQQQTSPNRLVIAGISNSRITFNLAGIS